MIKSVAALAALSVIVVTTSARAQNQSDSTSYKNHLITLNQLQAQGILQVHTLRERARLAESSGQFQIAADDLALAAVSASSFAQRDTIQHQLHTLLEKGHAQAGSDGPQVDSLEAELLDRAFQANYDRAIPVTKASPVSSGRTVLAEYATGTQCGVCWQHDRTFAALLQRYPSKDLVVLAYHDGPGYPIAYERDSLWSYVAYNRGLYQVQTVFGAGDLGWIDGQAITDSTKSFNSLLGSLLGSGAQPNADDHNAQSSGTPYERLSTAIDNHLQRPPEANITMTLTPSGMSDTGVVAVHVQLHVTPTIRRPHLAVRLALVQDTVRVMGFTNRRLQYAAVRTVAWFGTPRSLFSPLPAESTGTTTLTYTFDVAALQRHLLAERVADEDAREAFPDPQSWRIQPRRLGVVAIVQDRDTKEVLQTLYQRVFPLR